MNLNRQISLQKILSIPVVMNPRAYFDQVWFISNFEGHMSLYSVSNRGGRPQRLIPENIALQNPTLMHGAISYAILPKLKKILLMLDHDGDERYQPHFLPLNGGQPVPLFETPIGEQMTCCDLCDEFNLAYCFIENQKDPEVETIRVNLETLVVEPFGKSKFGNYLIARNKAHTKLVLGDFVDQGDLVLYNWDFDNRQRVEFFGTPPEKRTTGYQSPSLDLRGGGIFSPSETKLFMLADTHDDRFAPVFIDSASGAIERVEVQGASHEGSGEMACLYPINGDTRDAFYVEYNIDGASQGYLAILDENQRTLTLGKNLCGVADLKSGVTQDVFLKRRGDKTTGCVSFSNAKTPSRIYLVGDNISRLDVALGDDFTEADLENLAEGESFNYRSHDGLMISSRLYLPSSQLSFRGPRPLITYIHGGPQSQERPDFSWFSMPLIQWFARNGFAVFVPNVRGSTGYGLKYTEMVRKDWGGNDRLDHAHGLKLLENDPRINSKRRGVIGRSYGGYMTLMLASRHPEMFQAACDLFGPYDLPGAFFGNMGEHERVYAYKMVGDPRIPEEARMLIERSPKTHLHQLQCPLMVIQGKNDPRVKELESRALVETLRSLGKNVEYLCFDDEGHDVIKMKNKLVCYERLTWFFEQYLG